LKNIAPLRIKIEVLQEQARIDLFPLGSGGMVYRNPDRSQDFCMDQL
jgi:hypothetical protein